MGKITKLKGYLSESNHFSNYLPVFRVYIAYHIIKKIYLSLSSFSLLTGDFIEGNSTLLDLAPLLLYKIGTLPIFFILMILLTVFYGFGIGKRWTILLLAIFMYVFNNEVIALFGNGGDNYLTFIIIYLIFTDSFEHLSFSKLDYKKKELKKLSNFVSNLAVYSIMIHICLIYFVSFIHKIHSDVWYNGVATYYILNLERYTSPFNYLFSKNAFFIGFSTYFTLAFEMLFPFFIWKKKYRNLLLISGILLHLGIYFSMMIYDFSILFIMVYGFFLSKSEWSVIFQKINQIYIKLWKVNKL